MIVKRIRVHTRREHPLLIWLGLLVIGQWVGAGHTVAALLFVFCSSSLALWCRAGPEGLVLLLGFLSTYDGDTAREVYRSDLSYWVRIDESPRFRHLGGVEISATVIGGRVGGAGPLTTGALPHRILCRGSDVPWRNAGLLRNGDLVWLRGTLHSLRGSAPLTYEGMLVRRGYEATCALNWISAGERNSTTGDGGSVDRWVAAQLPANERSALIRSMVLGTRDILSPETETLFRFFGLTHLLVLSGFQVTLVFTLVHQALMSVRWLLWRHVDRLPLEPLATLGGLSVAVGLVACTGFEASGNRALIAVVLAAGADAYEARWSGSLAIVGVAFIMELLWPLVVFEPGAALTFAALVGLQLGRRYGNGFFAAVVSSLGASLCVSAVSMIWFPPPSWYGMLVGLMVTPVFSFVILWGAIVGLGVDLLSGGGVSGLLSGSAYLVEMLTLCLEWLRRVIVDSGWG